MIDLYETSRMCLRYLVPFTYEEEFKAACDIIEDRIKEPAGSEEEKKIWEKRLITESGAESDLYQYIREEFRIAEEDEKVEKAGYEWLLLGSKERKEHTGEPIIDLLYFPEGLSTKEDTKKALTVEVVNAGLYLFRNGLGIFWYELSLLDKTVTKPKRNTVITAKQLVTFQNKFRELNRNKPPYLWKAESDSESGHGISPFSMGEWVQDTIGFLQVKYFAERRSAVEKSRMVADKAILFTYASFEKQPDFDTEEDRIDLLYHLTNGYNENYHCSKETAKEVKKPFDDVRWYATQEGAAYLAWPSQDNRKTFENVIPGKIRTDYFTLYLKTLYQSYSLLIYADKIQREIPASLEKYKKTASESEIGDLNAEINLFLAKSMATSVSHIHHQSEFYVYLQERLRILENVNSVTAGLNALESLQREQQEEREKKSDNKLQAILGAVTFLSIFSTAVDGFELWKLFAEHGEWYELSSSAMVGEGIWLAVIAVIAVAVLMCTVIAIRKAFGFGKGKSS